MPDFLAALFERWNLQEYPLYYLFFVTGNYAFLALVLIILLLFSMMAPSKVKVLLHLQISEAELDEL